MECENAKGLFPSEIPKDSEERDRVLKNIQNLNNAKREISVALYKKYTMLQLELGEGDYDLQLQFDKVKELKSRVKDKKSRYCFFTLNFKPNTELNDVLYCMHQIVNKCWVRDWKYCIEQRGKTIDEMGKGLHVHLLMPKPSDKQPWNCKNEVWNNFKPYCGLDKKIVFDKHFIIIPNEWAGDKLEYMKGNKYKDESGEKAEKVKIDLKFRESKNLQQLYSGP